MSHNSLSPGNIFNIAYNQLIEEILYLCNTDETKTNEEWYFTILCLHALSSSTSVGKSLMFQVKQRIIDVDTKNSLGLVGHIEELSHNALAVYWNPLESPAKVNLAVQCLSTDFR